jgi:formiminotetrahydrofolate cyclodeaminase
MNEHSEEQKIAERREFLKKAGKVAITVPAVALLLSAASKRANAAATTSVLDAAPDLPG